MATPPDSIAKLLNLGPQSSAWLHQIGIRRRQDLEAIGPLEAYRQIRSLGLPASLNLVYAIQGALTDTHWLKLPQETKDELKVAVRLMADDGASPDH